jgi:hypothetical protein
MAPSHSLSSSADQQLLFQVILRSYAFRVGRTKMGDGFDLRTFL